MGRLGEPRVIQNQAVQNRGLQTVHVDAVFDNVHAQVVRLADRLPRLDAAAGQEEAICYWVMIEPRNGRFLGANAAVLASPRTFQPYGRTARVGGTGRTVAEALDIACDEKHEEKDS